MTEIEEHDWSLTPGRYVGVAPEDEDEDFDFEEALRSIHIDLQGLNEEAVALAVRIARNFEELGGVKVWMAVNLGDAVRSQSVEVSCRLSPFGSQTEAGGIFR